MNFVVVNWRDVRNPRAGGAETYVHEISKRWVARGHRVRFLTAGFRGAPARETIDGVEISRVGNRFTVYALVALCLMLGFARGADAIVDAENGVPFFAPLFARAPVVLLMFHVHKSVFHSQLPIPAAWLFTFIETRVMPYVYRRATWIAISPSTARDIEREFRPAPQRITIAHSGVGRDLGPGTKARVPTLVYVGRLEPYKRLDVMLRVVARLRPSLPELHAVIAGTGTARDHLHALAEQLGLGDAVTFAGYVSDARKAEILREAWCFLTPSSMEGWGIAVIEANACGTPALAFDIPGVRDAIVDGETGFLARDEDDLAGRARELLTDLPLRERLSQAAARHAARFDWETTASTFLRALYPEPTALECEPGAAEVTRSQRSSAT